MPSLESETGSLAQLCSRCGGKCCRGHLVFVSGEEYGRLKKILDFDERRIDTPYGCVKAIDALEKCPFLGKEKDRCILEGTERPLVCRLFPINFVIEKRGVRFYLSRLCPFAEEVKGLENWTKRMKEDGLKELSSSWTGKEISCYGTFFRKDKNNLMEI